MKITDLKVIVALLLTIGGAGYTVATTFATNDDLKVASTKAEVALDISIDSLISKLTLLETKPNKTPYDLAKIKYLQDEIKRLRQLRRL